MFESSANISYLKLVRLNKSLIHTMINYGHKLEPLETPHDTFSISASQLSKLTHCFLFSK